MRSEKRPVQAASRNIIPNPDTPTMGPRRIAVKETPGVEHAIATTLAREIASYAPGIDLVAVARELENLAGAYP